MSAIRGAPKRKNLFTGAGKDPISAEAIDKLSGLGVLDVFWCGFYCSLPGGFVTKVHFFWFSMKELPSKIRNFLDDHLIDFTVIEHAPITTCAEGLVIAEIIGSTCCKSLLLKNKKKFYLFVIPGEKQFESKKVSAYLGIGHLSFASEGDLRSLMNTFPGAVSVLGLIYDKEHKVSVYFDESLLSQEKIDCHPCRNDMSLVISVKDLAEKFFPALGNPFQAIPSELLSGVSR